MASPYDIYRRLLTEVLVYHDDKYGFYALSRYEECCQRAERFRGTYSSSKGPDLTQLSTGKPETS